MKAIPSLCLRRALLFVALGAVGALFTGCLEQRFVWSPDGQRAAVITSDGLRLSDASGRLSPVRSPHVHRVAWLGDSQRLVIGTHRQATDWAELARELGPEKTQLVVSRADALWRKLQAGAPWSDARSELGGYNDYFFVRYLHSRHGDALRQKLPPETWNEIKSEPGAILELKLVRIDGDRVVEGAVLHRGLGRYLEIRMAPDDRAVAIVVETPLEKTEIYRLLVTPLDAPAPTELASMVAAYPDWSSDGQSVAYIQAAAAESERGVPRLGSLVLRRVWSAEGKIAPEPEPRVLAGLVFEGYARVRCLRDGRILFNAAELTLPMAASDFGEEREQLFAADIARQATLTRLIPRGQERKAPKALAFFEVSPDEKRILFGAFKGEVGMLTLATGEVGSIQAAQEDLQGAPQWRNPDEFTYVRRNEEKNGAKPARKAELVLRKGDEEQVLSAAWPAELVNEMF